MVDPHHAELVQGFPDVLRRAFLTRMGHGWETLGAGTGEDALELAWRMPFLGAVQADGDEVVAEWQCLVQGGLGGVFGEVTQEAQDQPAGHAQLLLAVGQRLGDAAYHHLEGNAAIGVGLGIEEGLGVDDVLLLALEQIGPGQVIEVLLGTQHVGAGVVEVEEFLQVAEVVGGAQGLDVRPGQGDAMALGQLEQQLGLQGAFQVQVQFGLGQGIEPVVHGILGIA